MKKGPKIPTDRSFGFTFAVVFGLVAGWLFWRSNRYAVPVAAFAGAFAVLGWLAPRVLHPLNVVWMRFGLLLNRIVSPIVLGIIFFGVFTPVSMLFRLIGRDALRRSFVRDQASYWIERSPPGPEGKSFPQQF